MSMQSIFLSQQQIQDLFERESVQTDFQHQVLQSSEVPSITILNECNEFQQDEKQKDDQRKTDKQLVLITIDEFENQKQLSMENQQLKSDQKLLEGTIMQLKLEQDRQREEYERQNECDKQLIQLQQSHLERLKQQIKGFQVKQNQLLTEVTEYHEQYMQSQQQLINALSKIKNMEGRIEKLTQNSQLLNSKPSMVESPRRNETQDSKLTTNIELDILLNERYKRGIVTQMQSFHQSSQQFMSRSTINSNSNSPAKIAKVGKSSPTKNKSNFQTAFTKQIQKVQTSSDHGCGSPVLQLGNKRVLTNQVN